ncbi:MAG: DUF6599 family protein [candidate division KSB1 bacterium]|jgi:hypothetical protein|nr:DUF6599 family protein [candidate division KSB1 bacterium]
MKRYLIHILLLSLVGCSTQFTGFPEINGWSVDSEIKMYNPGNLYEYINGAAEQYIEFGFQSLQSGDLAQESVTVTLDIYDMGSPLNALGMYRIERPADAAILKIGAEACITPPYQALLLKDRYYVKVSQFEGDITSAVGEALLLAISKRIPGENAMPGELAMLPEQGRIAGSESFAREGFSGLSELANCIYAEYDGGHQYFIMLPASPEDPLQSAWQMLSQKWKHLKYKDQEILYRKIPYKGLIGVVMLEEGILGITGCKDEATLAEMLTMN